ncbi:serine/threonine-protein kinase [Streptomyces sp. NPDC001941]|uniref:serine/threonine-protein kinase n=1 Tax=Streptomyces sp. NPDC001941 TaxID=3154659 RepID=UPI0033289633
MSLADLVEARGPLPPQEVADIGRQVAAALAAAHRMGITHRDIKPANILLEDGRAVLTDFGIAAVEGDATLTATGMIMGTPAFMAPEQVRGLPATAESDLWSLGATLYAAVEGRPPFDAMTPSAVLVAVATEEPAPAVRAGPLAPVLAGVLRKEPAERLTMEQLQARLAQPVAVRAQAPVGAPPHSPASQQRTVTAMAPRPAVPPTAPAAAPGAAPAGPVPPRRRWSTRRTVLGVGAVVTVLIASVTGYAVMKSDAFNSTYQANLSTAEGAGTPSGCQRGSGARASGDRARMTYTAGCADYDACGSRTDSAKQWLAALPGVAAIAFDRNSACLTSRTGCDVQVTATPPDDRPAVRRALLRLTVEAGSARHPLAGAYHLEVDFGR